MRIPRRRSRLTIILLLLAMGFTLFPGPQRVRAGTTTIGFDDQSSGTQITTQYHAQGVDFVLNTTGSPGGNANYPTTQSSSVATSSPNVADIFDPACSGEFCSNETIAKFSDPHGTVWVWVGDIGPTGDSAQVTFTGYKDDGTTVSSGGQTSTTVTAGAPMQEMEISSSTADTFFAVVQSTSHHKVLVMDDLAFDVPSSPPPPTCAITRADAGGPISMLPGASTTVPLQVRRSSSWSGNLSLNGSGGGFSIFTSPGTVTGPGDDSVTASLTAPATESGDIPITISGLPSSPGYPTCSITFTVTVRSTVAGRIVGMEVSQGIQALSLPARGDDPNATVSYSGVSLVAQRKTVVRVFANVLYPPPSNQIPNVQATLTGFADGSSTPLAGSPLNPLDGTRTLIPGGSTPSLSDRASPTGAFTFVLPPAWTQGTITLQAQLYLPSGAFSGVEECKDPSCLAWKQMTMTQVAFTPTGYIDLQPVDLYVINPDGTRTDSLTTNNTCYRTRSWHDGVTELSDPYNCATSGVFSATDILPLGDGHVMDAGYYGAIDISAITRVTQAQVDAIFGKDSSGKSIKTLGTFQGELAASTLWSYADDRNWFSAADEWNPQSTPFIIGVYPNGFGIRSMKTSDCTGSIADCDEWPYAVVQDQGRPMTSVLHETTHMFGIKHASNCTNDGPVGNFTAWPDAGGYIEGVGLDTRETDIPGMPKAQYPVMADATLFPGQPASVPAHWYDYMSYCASPSPENDSWISTINWNEILGQMASGPAGATLTAAPVTGNENTLSVDAIASDGKVFFTRVATDTRPDTGSDPAADFHLLALDKSGKVLSDIGLEQQLDAPHGETPVAYLHARIPADNVATIEIAQGSTVLSRRDRGPAPSVNWVSPHPGDTVGSDTTFQLQWQDTATTAKDSAALPTYQTQAQIDFSIDNGTTWKPLYSGPDTYSVSLDSNLLSGSNQARFRVRINDGFNETSATTGIVTVPGHGPTVRILSPSDETRMLKGASMFAEGTAYNDQGARVTDGHLTWYLNDKKLGTGSSINLNSLATGNFRLILYATDASGRTGSADICLHVVKDAGVSAATSGQCPSDKVIASAHARAGAFPLPWWLVILILLGAAAAGLAWLKIKRSRRPSAET